MKTLCLLRHAKSSWADPAQDDHDRPLASRGREAAPRIAGWIREHGPIPDLVLCSSAARARETWTLMAPDLGREVAIRELRELYTAEPAQLLEMVQGAPAEHATLMLVGHNPAFGALAAELVGQGDAKLRRRMSRKFPTAALAVITFEADRWPDVRPGSGTLSAFVRPKDLK